jgi:L-cysteine desulfidase
MFTLKEFLRTEVKPALGCTEPGAIALAVARARQELPPEAVITKIRLKVSDSIYKNGMAVGIPGANGAKGNVIAAALGALCGDYHLGLEVLKGCQPWDLNQAHEWINANLVAIECLPEHHGVYIEASVYTQNHYVTCVLEKDHSNISKVIKDDELVFSAENRPDFNSYSITGEIGELSYHQVFTLADQMDAEDMEYIMEGLDLNLRIAEYGLNKDHNSGLGFGQALHRLINQQTVSDDLGYLIKSYCYAAADARMSGVELPVMSSAGSGNNGITAILPVALVGRKLHKSKEEITKAVIISHLSTSYIKSKIGRLSPVCGCAVAAGAGASAGITLLLGGGEMEAAQAIQTVLAGTSGLLCDGAKESCALKVGIGACEAYMAALFALAGKSVNCPQGVVETTVEQTIDNVRRINQEGMGDVDRVMIGILETRNHASQGTVP